MNYHRMAVAFLDDHIGYCIVWLRSFGCSLHRVRFVSNSLTLAHLVRRWWRAWLFAPWKFVPWNIVHSSASKSWNCCQFPRYPFSCRHRICDVSWRRQLDPIRHHWTFVQGEGRHRDLWHCGHWRIKGWNPGACTRGVHQNQWRPLLASSRQAPWLHDVQNKIGSTCPVWKKICGSPITSPRGLASLGHDVGFWRLGQQHPAGSAFLQKTQGEFFKVSIWKKLSISVNAWIFFRPELAFGFTLIPCN